MSYGSNLSSQRFRTYLEGGTPPGRTIGQQGARDPSLWREVRALRIPHRLFFAGDARSWGGGGVAFIDPAPFEAETRGCGYLITEEQFQDVLAQESRREVGNEVDVGVARESGSAVLGEGNYDLVIHLGDIDGAPMYTFTTPHPADQVPRTVPGHAYHDTLVAGLVESHGLTEVEARAYLARWSTPVR